MKKILVPKYARLFPNTESRKFNRARNAEFTPDKFLSYNDWFYFIHVDPYLRLIHALGMTIGTFLYVIAGYKLYLFGFKLGVLVEFLTGVFFFYFLPLLSHYFYDGGSAKAEPDKLLPTFIPVIHINFLTISGRYDRWLREFIKKYPFTLEAWKLEERER